MNEFEEGVASQMKIHLDVQQGLTAKRGRNCKCHYLSAFKAKELDEDSAVLK